MIIRRLSRNKAVITLSQRRSCRRSGIEGTATEGLIGSCPETDIRCDCSHSFSGDVTILLAPIEKPKHSSPTVVGMKERTASAAAKAALKSFARACAIELAVNAVAPVRSRPRYFAGTRCRQRGRAPLPVVDPDAAPWKTEEVSATIAFLLSN